MIEDNRESIMKFISQDENKEDYFVTHDKKYIIKTISRQEHKIFLKEILKPYHHRVIQVSFLQRVYGLYKLTYNGEYVRVMVFKNILFDQIIDSEPRYISNSIKCINTLDEFLNLEPKFSLSHDEGASFNQIMDKDLCFLKSLQIINFSILIIINNSTSEDELAFKGVFKESKACLTVSISDFICGSSSKKAKRNQAKQEDSDEDIKESLSKIISL